RLRWYAAPDISLDLNAALIDMKNGYDVFTLDNGRDTLADEPGVDNQRSRLLSARLSIDTSAYFALQAIAGWGGSDIVYGYDEDWIHTGFHPDEYSSTDYFFRDRSNLSAELRLLSKDAGLLFVDTTDWVVGLYTLRQDVD